MSRPQRVRRDDDDPIEWLTLDEVAKRLRFPSRRALVMHLRRHPVKVYQRAGTLRYFMRADEVDALMVPVSLVKHPKPTAVPVVEHRGVLTRRRKR